MAKWLPGPVRIGRRAAGLGPDSAIGLAALSWHNADRPNALGDPSEICLGDRLGNNGGNGGRRFIREGRRDGGDMGD